MEAEMAAENDLYQIGDVAKESGVTIDTIRYYEKLKLLNEPIRSEGGFRKYPREAVQQLRFIKKAKSFGLTLAEITEIMQESAKGLEECCGHVDKILHHKLDELEARITELRKTKKGLRDLIQSWIPLEKAKGQSFAVCPQIEIDRKNKKRRKRHAKKKS
jgi:DNA-binding transcriptional MerR regulator